MFALRSYRSSALATVSRPWLAARPFQTSHVSSSEELMDMINTVTNVTLPGSEALPPIHPPTAGAHGYGKRGPRTKTQVQPIFDKERVLYRMCCHSSRNNTIVTLTRADKTPVMWFSGGSCGFKKGNRGTYEAGYQCVVRTFKAIEELVKKDPIQLELSFKGFGQGREALRGALMTAEGDNVREFVVRVTDRTPIKIGGTRAPKTRRL